MRLSPSFLLRSRVPLLTLFPLTLAIALFTYLLISSHVSPWSPTDLHVAARPLSSAALVTLLKSSQLSAAQVYAAASAAFGLSNAQTQIEQAAVRPAQLQHVNKPKRAEQCSRLIVYDKPFKTGSTAVSCATRRYLAKRGVRHWKCGRKECLDLGERICNGDIAERSLLGHFLDLSSVGNGSHSIRTMECLKERGFYAVTSVREPKGRWRSMFLFNKQMKGTHYGISYKESYRRFLSKMPQCVLLDFYDGEGKECDGRVEERTRKIAGRFDEVIDLFDEVNGGGELRRRIAEHLVEENVSNRKKGGDGMQGELDEEVLRMEEERIGKERLLYDALKARGRVGGEGWLCDRIGDEPDQADRILVASIEEDVEQFCPNGA